MSNFAAKALVLLALIVQMWIGAGRGQVVCLSLHGGLVCPHWEAATEVGHHHDDGHGHDCDGAHEDACGGDEGVMATGGVGSTCDCCVHVPVPDPMQTSRSSSAAMDVKLTMSPVLVAIVCMVRGDEGWSTHPVRPPDWSETAQALALKVTRLQV